MTEEHKSYEKTGGYCINCKQWTFTQGGTDGEFDKPSYCASCGEEIDSTQTYTIFL